MDDQVSNILTLLTAEDSHCDPEDADPTQEPGEYDHNDPDTHTCCPNNTISTSSCEIGDVDFEQWKKIPLREKKRATQQMKVSIFWNPLVLGPYTDTCLDCFHCKEVYHWAMVVGFIDSEDKALSLKRLRKVEILEAVLRAMEKGSMKDDQTRHMICVCYQLQHTKHKSHALDEAMLWLRRTGEPAICRRLQSIGNCGLWLLVVQKVFGAFAGYLKAMSRNKNQRLATPCVTSMDTEKSEVMRTKGNELFHKKKYDAAVKSYSKAIQYNPISHVIYGNRALCFIRCEEYLKAVADGKKAVLIAPTWAKGHYRYCEALFGLGEHQWAIDSNALAQKLCTEDPEGIKDLQQQLAKFTIDVEEMRGVTKAPPKKLPSKISGGGGPDNADGHAKTKKPAGKAASPINSQKKAPRQASKPGGIVELLKDFTRDHSREKQKNPSACPEGSLATEKEVLIITPTDIVLGPRQASKPGGIVDLLKDFTRDRSREKQKNLSACPEGSQATEKAPRQASKPGGIVDLLKDFTRDHSREKQKNLSACPEGSQATEKTSLPDATGSLNNEILDDDSNAKDEERLQIKPQVEGRSGQNGSGLKTETVAVKKECDSADNTIEPKQVEVVDKTITECVTTDKLKGKNRSQPLKAASNRFNESTRRALKSAVEDAHTALSDQRSRNAEQAFSQALVILESNTPKELGISLFDQYLLVYGRASALVEIGQPEDLAEAEREFDRIKSWDERKFQCLGYFGIGKVYLKLNRFPDALEQFSDSLQMVRNQITPGKLTWPMTKAIVKETEPGFLKELLQNYIEQCKFPPRPDASCQQPNCHGHSKIAIFFTDPDFKGFIRLFCCQNCILEYHINCWKTLKAASFSDRSEKDFLQETCFTPDCGGKICRINIYGSTGLVKCKFEAPITRPEALPKVKVNQKCSSLKSLQHKAERNQRRRERRQAAIRNTQSQTELVPLERSDPAVVEAQEKADRLLLLINENIELFAAEGDHIVAPVVHALKPWMKDDKMLEHATTMREVVDLLLKTKSRVAARVLIKSFCLPSVDCSPKLFEWAEPLDEAGLTAATMFFEQHAAYLKTLPLPHYTLDDRLKPLIVGKWNNVSFVPFIDYLEQAPPQEKRLYIWYLDQNREPGRCLGVMKDDVPPPTPVCCHNMLNEYFEKTDGLCMVPVVRKFENDNSNESHVKTRNRNRKKKQKEPKKVIYMGLRRTQEEAEEDFLKDDESLGLLDPNKPFSVPNHLQDRVAEFEGRYMPTLDASLHGAQYEMTLDDNPDLTEESLYDYFAQILDQYGPLVPQDPLLVGQLVNFPLVAQQKIQEAGGLKPFLLHSLRFVMTHDHHIGLRHDVSLQHSSNGAHGINDLDGIGDGINMSTLDFTPVANGFLPGSQASGLFREPVASAKETVSSGPVLTSYLHGCENIHSSPETHLSSASRYTLSSSQSTSSSSDMTGTMLAVLDDGTTACATSDTEYYDCYPYHGDTGEHAEWDPALSSGASSSASGMMSSQVTCDSKRDVAVNTEAYAPYEVKNGDMNKKERDNDDFRKQIHQMQEEYETVKRQRLEARPILEAELQEIKLSMEITQKELGLFQQKLEDVVKEDQQEKKQNQETLKALKAQMKELTETQESITKKIKEKNREYETHLNDFLELSNQSAGEKMSLEDEIKRCRDLCSRAAQRSQAAELSILENRGGRGLCGPYRCLSDAKTILAKLMEVAPRYPPAMVQPAIEAWSNCAQEAENKIQTAKAAYQDQMAQVRRGTRLSTLPIIIIPGAPQLPPIPLLYPTPMPPHQQHPRQRPPHPGFGGPVPVRGPFIPPGMAGAPANTHASNQGAQQQAQQQAQASYQAQANLSPMHQLHQPNSVFEKILERLSTMFPLYSRGHLINFVQEMCSVNGVALNSLRYDEIINRAAQHILDNQDNTKGAGSVGRPPVCGSPARSDSPTSTRSATNSPPVHAWKTTGSHGRTSSKALHIEDPCIICHDDMSKEDLCVLECRHSFHRECIKSWLREQSTCPTCREHALLPEDFPLLPGTSRIRRGPAHTSST